MHQITVTVLISLILGLLYTCLAQELVAGENPMDLISNVIPVIHDPYEQQYQQQSSNPPIIPGANYDDFTDDYNTGVTAAGSNQIPNSGRAATTRRGGRRFGSGDLGAMPRSDNRGRYMDDLLMPARSNKCDRRIRVINGATRIRDRGALVRFQCSYGFHMLGVSVAVCVRGQWSDPPPTCVRDGCRKLPIPLQGSLRQLYGGGVAVFSCNYGYELQGQRILTCDGQKWNGSAPVCREIPPITIAPPSTTFPSLPELVTTEGTIAAIQNRSSFIDNDASTQKTLETDNAPPVNGRLDDFDPDFVLVPSSPPAQSVTVPTADQVTPRIDDEQGSDYVSGRENAPSPIPMPTSGVINQPDFPLAGDYHNSLDPWASLLPMDTTTWTPQVDVAPGPPIVHEPSATPKFVVVTATSLTTSTLSTTTKKRVLLLPATTPGDTVWVLSPTMKTPSLQTTTTTRKSGLKWTTTPWWMRARSPKPTKSAKPSTTTRQPIAAPADQSPLPYNPIPRVTLTVSPPRFELVPAINPEKLDDSAAATDFGSHSAGHVLITLGIILIVLGALTIVGGVVTYYWRKNIGIARARSHDIDGRTLNMSEGSNEEFMWSESRDSGL